jgi:KaiC/GvpD/RAD55 family RecA-like ATPase
MPRFVSAEKQLPHNLDAERAVLGAILLDNAALTEALKHVSASDFFFDAHRRIFSRITAMCESQRPVDSITLLAELQSKAELEAAGGVAYIAALTDGVPKWTNVEHYARIVREKAVLRRIAHSSQALSERALETGANPDDLLTQARAMFGAILPEPMKVVGGNGHLSYSLMEFLKEEFPAPDHLVEGIIPRGGSVLIFALPHRLKSWFTLALALESSRAGTVMRCLEAKKPVRTLLIQVEDFPGQLQWRMRELLRTQMFQSCDPSNVRVIPRCGLNLPDEAWYQNLLRETEQFKADHVVFDVVRRIFRGDVNSPKDTAAFLEQVDRLREATGCAATLVHHSNKKDAEIMTAAAGSYNFPGWANVVIEFKRKTQDGLITHVEIEVDNKLAPSPEPMRMVLDLSSEIPVRLEPLEDALGIAEAQDRLGQEWTVRDLAEALEVHKSNAQRRLKKWLSARVVEKVSTGKRGRSGGLARFHFVGAE